MQSDLHLRSDLYKEYSRIYHSKYNQDKEIIFSTSQKLIIIVSLLEIYFQDKFI